LSSSSCDQQTSPPPAISGQRRIQNPDSRRTTTNSSNIPDPPASTPPSKALAELSLAHRRLSAKLDFTEQQLASVSLELASVKQELARAQRERDGEHAMLVELRRVEEDREEEVQWERGERKRVEEQKKLADLALAEYAALVDRLDPKAVPPPMPRRVTDNILQTPPVLVPDDAAPAVPPKANGTAPSRSTSTRSNKGAKTKTAEEEKQVEAPATIDDAASTLSLDPENAASAEAISNLLLGQRGVHRLFRDFSSAMTAKEKEIHNLQLQRDEKEYALATLRDQLEAETRVRVEAQNERDRVLRDDASAAKVVERYMTFSQKSHEQVHQHLSQQRQRAGSTQGTLRAEVAALRRRNRHEGDRSARLRAAAEEMAEQLGRESAGRRREVALRLGLIAAEEVRLRSAEVWLDRVRRARERPDGARDQPDYAQLVDDAVEILAPTDKESKEPKTPTSGGGFRARFLRRRPASPSALSPSQPSSPAGNPEEESLARVFLAEELVQHLVNDLQAETERRVELEKQRVEWLAKEAEEGVPAAEDEETGVMFDVENEDEKPKSVVNSKESPAKEEAKTLKLDVPEPPRTPSSPPPPPELDELTALFQPLEAQCVPLQKSLHDQSVSLKALRTSLPEPAAQSPLAPAGSRRAGALRALSLWPTRTAYDDLTSLLDSLHEVIEDARVDVEIALADEDRQFHGFAALLGVGASGVVQAASVLRDAKAYIATRIGDGTPAFRFQLRVADIENDLATIKRTLHEMEGMDIPTEDDVGKKGTGAAPRKRSPFATLDLRTVSPLPLTPRTPRPSPRTPSAPHALATALAGDDSDDDLPQPRTPSAGAGFGLPRPGVFASVGRSLSSGVVGAASGVARAPGRMGELAGGLYRPRAKSIVRDEREREERKPLKDEEGDVE
jgi:hypothetical protein